jgi:hypothetical protein
MSQPAILADEFLSDLSEADAEAAPRIHPLAAGLKRILADPNGASIGALARAVEDLLAELNIAQNEIPRLAQVEQSASEDGMFQNDALSSFQIQELGGLLLEIERDRTRD